MNQEKIRNITFVALFVAIISVVSQIAIPTTSTVPITIQIFVIAFTGYFLGPKRGIIAIFLYIMLGALGAPVFAGFKGGFYALLGPSGGFVWGFIIIVIFCAIFAKTRLAIPAGIIGTIICHILGAFQYSFVAGVDFFASFLLVSLPYLLKDIILLPLAYLLYKKLKRIIKE